MNKKTFLGLLIGGILIIIIGTAYLLRPSAEASEAIEAIPLAKDQIDSTSIKDTPTEEGLSEVPVLVDSETDQEGLVVFVVDQTRSEVSFSIDEILRDNPFTAIGKTNQVAGEIGINFSDPLASQLGTILINARTLQTDNSNRDRAIKNQILDTDEYEYLYFEPLGISGFPSEIIFGENISITIDGELTVRDVTNLVSFNVDVTLLSETEIQVKGTAIILRSDFDLKIPSVSHVAEVSDEVLLELNIYANSDE